MSNTVEFGIIVGGLGSIVGTLVYFTIWKSIVQPYLSQLSYRPPVFRLEPSSFAAPVSRIQRPEPAHTQNYSSTPTHTSTLRFAPFHSTTSIDAASQSRFSTDSEN